MSEEQQALDLGGWHVEGTSLGQPHRLLRNWAVTWATGSHSRAYTGTGGSCRRGREEPVEGTKEGKGQTWAEGPTVHLDRGPA